jgi:hypothetical protein
MEERAARSALARRIMGISSGQRTRMTAGSVAWVMARVMGVSAAPGVADVHAGSGPVEALRLLVGEGHHRGLRVGVRAQASVVAGVLQVLEVEVAGRAAAGHVDDPAVPAGR